MAGSSAKIVRRFVIVPPELTTSIRSVACALPGSSSPAVGEGEEAGAPLSSLIVTSSASDNAHTSLIPDHGIRIQFARALQLPRLFTNREGTGGSFHQRLHYRHLPVFGVPRKKQAAAADCAPHRCARLPSTGFFQSNRLPQRVAQNLG